MLRFLLAACLLILCGAPAEAHKTNLTSGRIVLDGAAVHYRLTVSAHDLAVLLDIPTDLVEPIPLEKFADAFTAQDDDVKVVLTLDGSGP